MSFAKLSHNPAQAMQQFSANNINNNKGSYAPFNPQSSSTPHDQPTMFSPFGQDPRNFQAAAAAAAAAAYAASYGDQLSNPMLAGYPFPPQHAPSTHPSMMLGMGMCNPIPSQPQPQLNTNINTNLNQSISQQQHDQSNQLGGARRKNATRETTATLKAWLYEHRKNPYPTKGEKIMLAIITRMSLNQVSTWFANARRRLKKENKIGFSPKNRGDELDSDSDDNLQEGGSAGSDSSTSSSRANKTGSSSQGNQPGGHKSGLNKISGSTSSDNMNMDDLDDLDDINDEELDDENDEDNEDDSFSLNNDKQQQLSQKLQLQQFQQQAAFFNHHHQQQKAFLPPLQQNMFPSQLMLQKQQQTSSFTPVSNTTQNPSKKPKIWSIADVATSTSSSSKSSSPAVVKSQLYTPVSPASNLQNGISKPLVINPNSSLTTSSSTSSPSSSSSSSRLSPSNKQHSNIQQQHLSSTSNDSSANLLLNNYHHLYYQHLTSQFPFNNEFFRQSMQFQQQNFIKSSVKQPELEKDLSNKSGVCEGEEEADGVEGEVRVDVENEDELEVGEEVEGDVEEECEGSKAKRIKLDNEASLPNDESSNLSESSSSSSSSSANSDSDASPKTLKRKHSD